MALAAKSKRPAASCSTPSSGAQTDESAEGRAGRSEGQQVSIAEQLQPDCRLCEERHGGGVGLGAASEENIST